MELNGKRVHVGIIDALTGAVADVDVALARSRRQRGGVDGVAVVLAGDEKPPALRLAHGLVAAAVAVLQLERRSAPGKREQLMPQADAEDGQTAFGH